MKHERCMRNVLTFRRHGPPQNQEAALTTRQPGAAQNTQRQPVPQVPQVQQVPLHSLPAPAPLPHRQAGNRWPATQRRVAARVSQRRAVGAGDTEGSATPLVRPPVERADGISIRTQ